MKKNFSLLLGFVFAAALMATSCQSSSDSNAASRADGGTTTDKVIWHNWGPELSKQATAEGKLVFLFLTTSWCTPCLETERGSFSNDKIAEILNNQYIATRVDAERYPAISERYSLGGYPSCVILMPDLRVLGGTVRVPADSLQLLLERANDTWRQTRIVAENEATRLDSLYRKAVAERRPQRPSDELLTFAEQAVYRHYDSTYGGFGDQPKFPLPGVNAFIYGATAPNGGPLFRDEVTHTLDSQTKLLDPVWGGFYRRAAFADWSGPSHEKLLTDNAQILVNYVDAYLITRDVKYRDIADKIVSYLNDFLRTGRGWGFYHSQAGVLVKGGELVDPQSYFALDNEDRRAAGIPAIEREIYVAANCYAVSAFLKAGRTFKRHELIEYAISTLDSVAHLGLTTNGLVHHSILSQLPADEILLEDQVALTAAMLDAYETTGEQRFLLTAEGIARVTSKHFTDRVTGGLNINIAATDDVSRMKVPIKPFEVNAAASTNFVRLYYHTNDESFKQPAETSFLYILSLPFRNDDLHLCISANAYLRITRYPIKVAMIGPRGADYDHLLEAAFSRNYPRLVLSHLGDGTKEVTYGKLKFAPVSRPQLFACGEDTLSRPVEIADSVDAVIREFQIELLKKR